MNKYKICKTCSLKILWCNIISLANSSYDQILFPYFWTGVYSQNRTLSPLFLLYISNTALLRSIPLFLHFERFAESAKRAEGCHRASNCGAKCRLLFLCAGDAVTMAQEALEKERRHRPRLLIFCSYLERSRGPCLGEIIMGKRARRSTKKRREG